MTFKIIESTRNLDQDLDAPVLYDINRMNLSLASGEIRVPKGLSPEARRRYVREQLSNVVNR